MLAWLLSAAHGAADWLAYVGEEIRNADRNTAGFQASEILAIPVSASLKAYPKGKTYAKRMKGIRK